MDYASQFEYVLTQLDGCKGEWKQIAEHLELSYSWLAKVAQRKIPNPGVLGVERLAAYFRALEAAADGVDRRALPDRRSGDERRVEPNRRHDAPGR